MKKKPPYKIKKTKVIYKNPFLSLSDDKIRFNNGKEFDFTKVEMAPGSSIVAINNKDDVYLVEEYKHATSEYSLEIISGRIDENESPLEAAKRELREEAGFVAKDWVNLGLVNPFTSVVKSPNYLYLARKLEETNTRPDESESLKIITLPFDKAVSMVMSGKITHAGSCVAILKAEKYLS